MDPYLDTLAARLAADPVLTLVAGIGAVVLAALLAEWLSGRRARRAAEPLAASLATLAERLEHLGHGQHQLIGGLTQVTEAQLSAQGRLTETLERRLEEVSGKMGESLSGSATRTARSLGELQQRLEAIDRAQTKIEKLSGDVLTLQDILSNKQTRGAFGEIQLREIVSRALPKDAYAFQATLSNGRRADCLIHLPLPPGPIVIDSKFPLEAYEALRAAETDRQRTEAARLMRTALAKHIDDIAGRYIVEGETANSALLFLPSEAVYAELHANHGETVRAGFDKRVWIVSPTTCMAVLNTMRGVLKDARMRAEAGRIRRELGLLHKDVFRLGERVQKLDQHFHMASQDLEKIKISAEKAGRRAGRLEAFDFEEGEAEAAPRLTDAEA